MGHLLHEVDPQQQYLFLSLLGQLFFYQPFVYPHFVNPLCIRGMLLHANTWIKCRGRNPPLLLFISYDAIVTATALIPSSANEAARVVPPTAVSEIVPLLSEIFDPPNVRTSVLPKL